jgi:hypothetical protein
MSRAIYPGPGPESRTDSPETRRHPSLEDHDHHELPRSKHPDSDLSVGTKPIPAPVDDRGGRRGTAGGDVVRVAGIAQVTFDEQTGSTRDQGPQEMSESNGSVAFLGYLLGGRSPAERVEFLAGLPIPAEPPSTPAGPRPRVYRNYTRRLREE